MSKNQVRLQIDETKSFAGGTAFGTTGPYEWLSGTVHYAIDPEEPGLPYVCDLDLAPRNAEGLVEFSGTFDLVKPVEMAKSNHRVLYEFSNRGGKTTVGTFNYGHGADWTAPGFAGDGFLMSEGYTCLWSGWQGDLIDTGNNCVALLPEALIDGRPIRGKVRQEFSTVVPGVLSMGASAGAERGESVLPYPVLDRATATLTMREHEADARTPVPESDWELAKARN